MKKVKRYNGEDGSAVEMDAEEAANKSTEGMLTNPNAKEFGEAGTSETSKATPKAMPRATPKAMPKTETKAAPKAESKAAPVDETKLSANERTKRTIEKNLSGARRGSGPTDTRSVSQRLRSAFGMRKGGETKKMASGGMTSSSASKRADGIAQRGKTRGKMC